MADVSRSVSLSKKLSSVNDVSSKHIYDDVFSAPSATKFNASTFSSRIDDYREIFPPSNASLGSSIPILDLPAVDRSDGFGRGLSSGVDYAGVFGGFGEDDGIGVLSEQLFGDSKKKAKREAQLPRSPARTRRLPSKSQEFSRNCGNDQTSTTAQTRRQYSKSQEFSTNFVNNQMSASPLQTRTSFSESEEFSGNLPNDQTSASALSHQTVDKRFSVSYHKTNQSSKDTTGMTHIAHLHAVPGYACLFDDEGAVRKTGYDKAKRMSMGDADFRADVGEVPRQGKHTRAVSDLGTNRQAGDDFVASHAKREANCKPQTYSMSVANSPQSFGSNDYFRRSASKRSKGSTNTQERCAAGDSSPSLLDEELDVNSAAAVSAAAMKRAIEEAEEKIRWAKEFLKGLEDIGFIKPTFKDSFKVKATIDTKRSSETCVPKQNGSLKVTATRPKKCINEKEVLKRNNYLNIKASGVNNHANKAGGLHLKDDLDIKATSESQLENEADGLQKDKFHGVAAPVGTNMGQPVSFRNSCAPETFAGTRESFQPEFVNNAELVDKINDHEELKLDEKICKHEGGGEWEAAKHLSQLISGVKNRLVSFISKQADTEKTVTQKERSEERAYEVQNVVTDKERGADLKHLQKQDEINHRTCSVAGEGILDSNRSSVGMEVSEAEENKVKGSGATLSPDVEMHTSEQCSPPEPEEKLERIEAQESANNVNDLKQKDRSTEVKGEHLQEVQEQNQEVLDGTGRMEYEKNQMGTIRLEESGRMLEEAYQPRGYEEKGTKWEEAEETVKELQDQEPVENRVDDSLSGEAVICRQVEVCSWEETDMPKDAQKKKEDVRVVEEAVMVEKRCEKVVGAEEIHMGEDTDRIAGQNVMSGAAEGLIEVVDEASEHDEYLAAADDRSEKKYELFSLSEEKEDTVHDKRFQYAENAEFSFEEKERMTEAATTPFEPKANVEQPRSVLRVNELIREGICEQMVRPIEVVDGDSEHDEYLPAIDDICEQHEQSFSSRNEEDSAPENINRHALDVDLPFWKERLAEPTFAISETEGNIEKPRSVQMANELIGDDMSEKTRFPIEAAEESLEHDHYLTAGDGCEKDESSFLNRNAEGYQHDSRNQCVQARDVKFSFTEKRTVSGGSTSESEGNVEQPSSIQTLNEMIGEQVMETSMSAGDKVASYKTEMKIEEAQEAPACTNIPMSEPETVLNFEQKHSGEEANSFATDIGPENQDDESKLSAREANKASEQDVSSQNDESPYKRKRWFENREKVVEFQRDDIFQGDEITLEMEQESAEGSEVKDKVEVHVDELVSEPGEGVHMEQADARSAQDQEGGHSHSPEGTHRRRRWFENSEENLLHKPIPFTGVGATRDMDNEIAQEFKHDLGSQNHVDKLVNERKDGAAVREINTVNDQVESKGSTEAAHRRRRWFENGEKLGAAQRPGVLEDDEATAELEKESGMGVDTAKRDELGEKSTSEEMANTHQGEGHSRREKEKEKLAVERAIREARQRAFTEARERAAAEARLKAAAAQDRQGKAPSEGKSHSDKASMDAKLRTERAAVERATAEARERALQRAMSDKATYNSREKDPKNQSSGYSTSVPFTGEKFSGAMNEPPERRKAISERNKRTMERAAKALEEKNMRDILAQKEQAERNRYADVLDAEVKRWLSGKEGNLRSLLSTLQYILGPDSGWQPIPLTDLVTTTAVRKAYKRAALCVHPDKLQQRRATIQQKYICEKVFDLLKDAWHRFYPDDR